jgi:Fe-S cluster biogenesis protein NfuA
VSNFLAIATVTETLRQMLDSAIGNTIQGAQATATAVRPANTAAGSPAGLPNPGVNVFLYQVTPNASWRNMDLPNRRSDGSLSDRPRVALDLHYLLTFYGQEGQLEPQRLLGRVVQVLHSQAFLTRAQIRSAITTVGFLSGSNLADDIEVVKFIPLSLSLEELSKLWSVFFQTAYTLSVAYQGTVVLIEGDESPQEALPVRERNLRVLPFQRPVIDEIAPQILEPGGTLTIRGRNLETDVVKVNFGRTAATPASITNTQIEVALPAGLSAGVNTVQVVQFLDFNTGPAFEPHRLFESNVAAFIVSPKINLPAGPEPVFGTVTRGAPLTLDVTPPVGRSQDVRLLLGNRGIVLAPRPPSAPPTTTSLRFDIPSNFPTGEFLVRVQVDGAQSKLVGAGATGYTGPKVVIACNNHCLRCTGITLNSTASGLDGLVTVEDETPTPVPGAEVAITWTLPGGTTQSDTQQTDPSGVATFSIIGGNGPYVLTINDITKSDSALDQQQSTLSKSIVK